MWGFVSAANRLLNIFGVAMAFIGALLAIFMYSDDDWRLFLISLFSLSFIAVVDHRERHLYPILLLVLIIRTLEFLFSLSLIELFGLTFLLMSGLLDLMCAFLLVHYSQEQSLRQLCKVQGPSRLMPQLHWMALLLGFSCFYRLAASAELIVHELDPDFFGRDIPFFFATGPIAMTILRIAIDTLLWSMLLFPRKFSQFTQKRPRNLSI